jgi:hypothetical protein
MLSIVPCLTSGAFAKQSGKSTTKFVFFFRPSLVMDQFDSHRKDFGGISYWGLIIKFITEFRYCLKYGKIKRNFYEDTVICLVAVTEINCVLSELRNET